MAKDFLSNSVDRTHLFLIKGVSRIAGAHVTAEGVGAASILAHLAQLVALIDVLENHGLRIGLEADATGADQVEISRARIGTFFAVRTPCQAHRAAASGGRAFLSERAAADFVTSSGHVEVRVARAGSAIHTSCACRMLKIA